MAALPPLDDAGADAECSRLRQELETARAALGRETAERRRLETGLAAAVANEREALAQRLHNTICQSLTATRLMVKALEIKWQRTHPQEAGEISELCELLRGSVNELVDIMRGLRAPAEDGGDDAAAESRL